MRGKSTKTARVVLTVIGIMLPVLMGYAGVTIPPEAPAPIIFARDELNRVIAGQAGSAAPEFAIEISGGGEAQSYRLHRNGQLWRAVGADAVGAMYGGLEPAEALRLGML